MQIACRITRIAWKNAIFTVEVPVLFRIVMHRIYATLREAMVYPGDLESDDVAWKMPRHRCGAGW
jgi:hypothetical protein